MKMFAVFALVCTLLLGVVSCRIERSPFLLDLEDRPADYLCIGAAMEGAPANQVRDKLAITIAYSMGTENWIGLPFVELKNRAYLTLRFSDTKINRMFASGHRDNLGDGRLSFDEVANRIYGRNFCEVTAIQRIAVIQQSEFWRRQPPSNPAVLREIERLQASGIETGFYIPN